MSKNAVGIDAPETEKGKPETSRTLMPRWVQWVCAPDRPVSLGVFAWIGAGVVLFDQLSKFWAVMSLPGRRPIEIVPNFFHLAYAQNTGAAFSFMTGRVGLLAIISMIVAAGVTVWAWRMPRQEHGLRIPLALIVGGAVGNFIDRVRLQYVVDFIDVHWYDRHWPTFNLADSAICVGMVILILASFHPRAAPARKSPPEA